VKAHPLIFEVRWRC